MKSSHKKSTLLNWKKDELADYIICLEDSLNNMRESFDIQYTNCLKLIDDMALINERYKEAKRRWWKFFESDKEANKTEKYD